MNKDMITYDYYEKISDEFMRLPDGWVIKFNVALNKYSEKYGRQSFHKEVMYNKNGNNRININRSFDYFLSIESKSDGINQKEFILIGVNDFYMFRYIIDKACEWFVSSEFSNIFAKKDGDIFMPRKVEPLKINNLPMGKYIEIEPTVFNADNGDQLTGVMMYFNSSSSYTFLTISRLFALKYMIDGLNMFESAQLMLNYMNRPQPGYNMYNMTESNTARNNYSSNKHINTTNYLNTDNNPLNYFNKINQINKMEVDKHGKQ